MMTLTTPTKLAKIFDTIILSRVGHWQELLLNGDLAGSLSRNFTVLCGISFMERLMRSLASRKWAVARHSKSG